MRWQFIQRLNFEHVRKDCEVTGILALFINECQSFIADIPDRCGGYDVISPVRKQVYMQELQIRADKLLEPTLHHILQEERQTNYLRDFDGER